MINIATVCSGVGAPEQAIKELGWDHEVSFACEIDKYARITYEANHPGSMMLEDMTSESWKGEKYQSDLFIGGIPCQAFSLAGKRLGELDPRGLLFYNFYDYLKKQQPKVFIIENVKGLLSTDKGRTFQNWIQLLGGSVNYQNPIFNHPDSLGYNLHWTVLNATQFDLAQNRERVFIVGIRKDLPNEYRFPVGSPLKLRLKDFLEKNVPEKYYLKGKIIDFVTDKWRLEKKYTQIDGEIALTQTARQYSNWGGDFITEPICVAMRGRDPENPSNRVAGSKTEQRLEANSQVITNTITTVQKDNLIVEPKLKFVGGIKKGELFEGGETKDYSQGAIIYDIEGVSCTLSAQGGGQGGKTGIYLDGYRIRRLTPRECFRLQGFPDSFDISKVSDTQSYKQAGNSMPVTVIKSIIKNLEYLFK